MAAKPSYLIAKKIAVSSKTFSDGEFIINCLLKATEIVCPEKRQSFANISLISSTISDCISSLAVNVNGQHKKKWHFQLLLIRVLTLQTLTNLQYLSVELVQC